jgi:hypothetical protein
VNSEGGGQSHLTAAPNPRKDNFIMPENNDSAAVEAVQPGSARWAELVQETIRIDASRNWFIGDACLEIAPVGIRGVPGGITPILQQFADETGIGIHTLMTCRHVAWAWPPETRVAGTGWSVHMVLAPAAYRHLIEPGMTVRRARAVAGHPQRRSQGEVHGTTALPAGEDRTALPRARSDDASAAEAAWVAFTDISHSLTEVAVTIQRFGTSTAPNRWLAAIQDARNRLDLIGAIVGGRPADDELAG